MIMEPDHEYVVSVSYLAMKTDESGYLRVSVWDDRKVGRAMFLQIEDGNDPRKALIDLDREAAKVLLFKEKLNVIDTTQSLENFSQKVTYASETGLICSEQTQQCQKIIAIARNEISTMGRRQSAKTERIKLAAADLARASQTHPAFFGLVYVASKRPEQFMREIWEPLMECIAEELEPISENCLSI